MMTEFPDTRATLLVSIKTPENREAWEEFVVIYRPVIYRLARQRGLQDADAQDLVQNVLIRVSSAIERYQEQPGVRFRHWLRTVTANAILTFLTRKPQDLAAGGTAVQDLLNEQSAMSTELEAELSTEYMREQYLRAAAIVRTEVNDETWQAFELTIIQEQSCEAAARALMKSIGTIYAARSRIIKRLRDQIERLTGAEQ
jgi:RNA polymerase sigma-70 factor (ECF subfamily)